MPLLLDCALTHLGTLDASWLLLPLRLQLYEGGVPVQQAIMALIAA